MNPVEHGHVIAVAQQNPRRKGEGPMHYVARLAVLAGLVEPEQVGTEPVGGWSSAGEALEMEEPWYSR